MPLLCVARNKPGRSIAGNLHCALKAFILELMSYLTQALAAPFTLALLLSTSLMLAGLLLRARAK